MKAGLVASLWAVRGLTELKVPLRGDLVLATVVGEEDGGLGTYALLRRGWRAEACVIPEPTSLVIAPASAGALTFRITVPGAATHASRRLSGVSAIEKFIPIFSALRRLEKERNAIKHPLAMRWELPIPIEIGKIAAGEWASNVPDTLNDTCDEEDQVEDKREGPGADQASLAAHAVHDRDGVDEDVERSRAGPQRDQEPDRDHCRTTT